MLTSEEKQSNVMFFIHGGGWKAGSSQQQAQVRFLSYLANEGWLVLVTNYNKNQKWPRHIDDVYASFLWASQNLMYGEGGAEDLIKNVTISGASAGGQLATLLLIRLLKEESRNIKQQQQQQQQQQMKFTSCVLFYPCLDPIDDLKATARFPFSFPCLRIRCNQSILSWFYQNVVLHNDLSCWESSSPLRLLLSDDYRDVAAAFPPTVCIHGDLDSIVPVEHSLALLYVLRNAKMPVVNELVCGIMPMRSEDIAFVLAGCKHSFELFATEELNETIRNVFDWLNLVNKTKLKLKKEKNEENKE